MARYPDRNSLRTIPVGRENKNHRRHPNNLTHPHTASPMQHPCTGLATLVHLQAKYADFLKRSIYFLKPNARIQKQITKKSLFHNLWGCPNFCDGNSFFVFFRFLHKNSGTLWNEKGNNKSNLRGILVSDSKSNTFSQSLYFRDFKSRNPFGFAAFNFVERAGFEPTTLWSQTRCASQTALPLEVYPRNTWLSLGACQYLS